MKEKGLKAWKVGHYKGDKITDEIKNFKGKRMVQRAKIIRFFLGIRGKRITRRGPTISFG